MRLLVRLEDGGARERLPAQGAAEGPLPRVHPAVVLHVVAQLERFAAVLALKGSVPCVCGQVRDQRADVWERLAAKLAEHSVWCAVHIQDGTVVVMGYAGEVILDQVQGLQRRRQEAEPWPQAGRRLHGELVAELERLQAVRQDVPRQFALVGERGTAVRAEEGAGRRAAAVPVPTPTPSSPQALALRVRWMPTVVRRAFAGGTLIVTVPVPIHFFLQRQRHLLHGRQAGRSWNGAPSERQGRAEGGGEPTAGGRRAGGLD